VTTAPERLTTVLADRYRIERPLGQGGMATVYLAQDLKHDREVALKVLRPELGAVLGPDRFLAEIKVTARLDHPHILTLIDSGVVDGFLYYVLPLVRGESLRGKLDREKQLGVDEALAITRHVASALDYAHRQGVVHRDIKPENILLQEGEAVLTDFGIALAVKEAGGNRLTETGLSLGTPQYMSPEQATGERTLDGRTDIYSLAAVLYEMLAGEPPVTGPSAQAMIAKLITERPVRLKVVRDAVPDAVDLAVAKALNKVPADRFTTAGEFAQSLLGSGAQSVVNARTRQRWVFAAAVAVAALLLGTAAAVSLRGRRSVSAPFTPRFEQLTTDGNARRPALSPDGTRLAYVARDCDEREHCTERLVVRDIGNAGSITVLKGMTIGPPKWAADGRFLVADLTEAGRASSVAVSALGGAARSLPGRSSGVIGMTDTVLVGSGNVTDSDSVAWQRVATASDGLVRDSIPIRLPTGIYEVQPAPDGSRIVLFGLTITGRTLRLVDRTGQVTDSLLTFPTTLRSVRWTPRADALVLQEELRAGRGPFTAAGDVPVPSVLIRYPVSSDGKFAGRIDTLMTLEPGRYLAELRTDGSALLSQGPVEAVVYALERSRPGRLDFQSRRLAASTAGIRAQLSRDGATVWLKHGGAGIGAPERNTFLPFEGGPERAFSLPLGIEISTDWTWPVSSALLYAVRDSAGQARLAEVDVATGRSRGVTTLPSRTSFFFAIPDGGYAVADVEAHSTRVVGRPGKPDTTWTAPATPGRMFSVPGGASRDGRSFLEFSESGVGGTVWVRRVPLDGGVASSAVPLLFDQWVGVLSDGSFESIRSDSTGALGWYRTTAGSSRSVRLGDAPVQGAATQWAGSHDGLRFVVVKPVDRPDIYLLRNFGELLKR
jgi:tRNA A-37 threonylcarbamoyl transferase component Bud32